VTATLLKKRLANSELYWEVLYDLTLSPCPSDMFTATMLYAARFATTQSKASLMSATVAEGLLPSGNTLSAMMLQPGAMPVYVGSCDPMMLATFDPWPLVSDAFESLAREKS
jgi:hypothetical protein